MTLYRFIAVVIAIIVVAHVLNLGPALHQIGFFMLHAVTALSQRVAQVASMQYHGDYPAAFELIFLGAWLLLILGLIRFFSSGSRSG